VPKRSKYPVLVAEAARRGVAKWQMAESGHMSTRSLQKRLYDDAEFSYAESRDIHRDHFPDMDRDELFRMEEI
jgi:hypothetical protein